MKQSLLIFLLYFSSLQGLALEGLGNLENNLFEKNLEIKALKANVESKQTLLGATRSGFYPTLSAIGGIGQNRTDDVIVNEKGYVGYLEGRLNLFRGFRDQTNHNIKDLDLKFSKLDMESRKRELRSQLVEIASDMIFFHKFQNILEDELKTAQSQKKMAVKKVSAGLTGSVDNLEFDLRESEVLIEQQQIAQQHLEAHQKLIKIMGEDIPDITMDGLEFSSVEKLLQASREIKIENTIDYQKISLTEERLAQEKKEIKADYLPALDFNYSFGRLTPSDENPVKFNENRLSLLLTIPLFSGFDTYYKAKSVALALQAAEYSKNQRLKDIRADLNIAKSRIAQLGALFEINEKRALQSQKYFDLTLAEYRRGIKNSPDLVSATDRLFNSKKRKYEILKELETLNIKFINYN